MNLKELEQLIVSKIEELFGVAHAANTPAPEAAVPVVGVSAVASVANIIPVSSATTGVVTTVPVAVVVTNNTYTDASGMTWTLPPTFVMPPNFREFTGPANEPIGWSDTDGHLHSI